MTVRIDETTAYEPDAQVYCGQKLSPAAAIEVPEPVIVAEVLSPSSRQVGLAHQARWLFPPPKRDAPPHRRSDAAFDHSSSRGPATPSHPRRHRGHNRSRSAGSRAFRGGRLRRLNFQTDYPAALVHERHRRKLCKLYRPMRAKLSRAALSTMIGFPPRNWRPPGARSAGTIVGDFHNGSIWPRYLDGWQPRRLAVSLLSLAPCNALGARRRRYRSGAAIRPAPSWW